ESEGLPIMPGAGTASEVMSLLERGYEMQKFFPAEAAGGVPMLKSWSSPIPKVSFCPTGGINLEKAKTYLALPNVVCVGGSWVAPDHLVQAGDWDAIRDLAREASQLGKAAEPV
ncbi:MAG: keto-deoxy-phosphogluconate aldolase, partial [Mangrovicoccus sp.]